MKYILTAGGQNSQGGIAFTTETYHITQIDTQKQSIGMNSKNAGRWYFTLDGVNYEARGIGIGQAKKIAALYGETHEPEDAFALVGGEHSGIMYRVYDKKALFGGSIDHLWVAFDGIQYEAYDFPLPGGNWACVLLEDGEPVAEMDMSMLVYQGRLQRSFVCVKKELVLPCLMMEIFDIGFAVYTKQNRFRIQYAKNGTGKGASPIYQERMKKYYDPSFRPRCEELMEEFEEFEEPEEDKIPETEVPELPGNAEVSENEKNVSEETVPEEAAPEEAGTGETASEETAPETAAEAEAVGSEPAEAAAAEE